MNLEEYRRMYEAEERQWWYVGMRRIAFALLDPSLARLGAERRLLDAGCGTGHNLQELAARGRATGVDLSPEALAFCRRRGVAAVRGNLLALPFPDATFAAVTSFDVLYHRWVSDDRAAVRELVRVLRPGGLLFVRVPALRMLWGAHDEAVHSRHRYTRAELVGLLRSEGLEVVRASYCNTLLFPLLALRRGVDRLSRRHGSDVHFLPAPLETLFRGLLGIEARLLRHVSLPIGASVVILGRRPA